jgi:hypothetical protein
LNYIVAATLVDAFISAATGQLIPLLSCCTNAKPQDGIKTVLFIDVIDFGENAGNCQYKSVLPLDGIPDPLLDQYDGTTVAADYYQAMQTVERQLALSEDIIAQPPSLGELIALVASLCNGSLTPS